MREAARLVPSPASDRTATAKVVVPGIVVSRGMAEAAERDGLHCRSRAFDLRS